jgi:O-antigen ligase
MPRLALTLVSVAVALPWLWPWAPAPSPSVPGLLAAWGVTAALWLWNSTIPSGPVLSNGLWRTLLLVAILLGIASLHMPVFDLALWGGLAGSILCVLIAERCGRNRLPLVHRALAEGVLWAAVASSAIAGLQYSGLLKEPTVWLTWLHASPGEEAYGQLRQRNQFGSLVSLGLAAWLYLVHTGWPVRGGRWLAWGSLCILTLGAVASTSRTGALAWTALTLLSLVCPLQPNESPRGPSVRTGAFVALMGFVLLCWLLPGLVASLSTVELPKVSAFERLVSQPEGLGVCESRIVLWRHVLELSWQRPWLGWGWGELDLIHATQPVQGERFCGQLGHAHNLFLQVAVEWGWPLALGGLGAALVWIGRHPPWRANTPQAVLGWSWLGVLGLHSLLEFPLWYGPFQLVLGLALGLVHQPSEHKPPTNEASPRFNKGPRAVLALWLICIAWAGWDYHRVSQVFQPSSLRSQACQHQPMICLDDVVWFHQARDFAQLQLARDAMSPDQIRDLAQRVAHYAPEPWVLALRSTPPTAPPLVKP